MKKTYYLDDNNNIVDEKKATHFIVSEYDEKGRLVKEEFYQKRVSKKEQDKNMDIEFTAEEQEFLNNITDASGNHPFRK